MALELYTRNFESDLCSDLSCEKDYDGGAEFETNLNDEMSYVLDESELNGGVGTDKISFGMIVYINLSAIIDVSILIILSIIIVALILESMSIGGSGLSISLGRLFGLEGLGLARPVSS